MRSRIRGMSTMEIRLLACVVMDMYGGESEEG